jgi:hypothetical protein
MSSTYPYIVQIIKYPNCAIAENVLIIMNYYPRFVPKKFF